MQTDYKQIYHELSEVTGKSEQMYKDIGSFIFQETARMMKNPESLIIKLKGVGSWHLRKKRMDIVVNEFTDYSEPKSRTDFESDNIYENYMEKHNRFHIFKKMLAEYDKYLTLKQEINKKRRETQVLLEPNNGEDSSSKSS